MRRTNRYLVFCRASDNSLHKEWITPKNDKNFDLFIEYYGNEINKYKEDSDYYSHHKEGRKFPRFYEIYQKQKELILEYDAVLLADDDISSNATNFKTMFEVFSKYQLSIAQPALTKDSFIAQQFTKVNLKNILRYTNVVEGMVPILSREALIKCCDTFNKSVSGWGLGWVWPTILGNPKNKIAIIDLTPVKHVRKAGRGDLYHNLNTSPSQEMYQLTRSYGVKPYNVKQFGKILKVNGNMTFSGEE